MSDDSNKSGKNIKNKCKKDFACSFLGWMITCIVSFFLNPDTSVFWRIMDCITLFIAFMGVTAYKYKNIIFK